MTDADGDNAFLDKLSDRDKQLLDLFLTSVEENYPKTITEMDRIAEKLDLTIQEMKDLRHPPKSYISAQMSVELGAKPAPEAIAAEIVAAGQAKTIDEVIMLPTGAIYVVQHCPKLRGGAEKRIPDIFVLVGQMKQPQA